MTKHAAHVHVRLRKLATYQISEARATFMREAPASLEAPLAAVLKVIFEEQVDFPHELVAFLLSEAELS